MSCDKQATLLYNGLENFVENRKLAEILFEVR